MLSRWQLYSLLISKQGVTHNGIVVDGEQVTLFCYVFAFCLL